MMRILRRACSGSRARSRSSYRPPCFRRMPSAINWSKSIGVAAILRSSRSFLLLHSVTCALRRQTGSGEVSEQLAHRFGGLAGRRRTPMTRAVVDQCPQHLSLILPFSISEEFDPGGARSNSATSHLRISSSVPVATTSVRPSGQNATDRNHNAWLFKLPRSWPVCTVQSPSIPSLA
jgi:hypothetical protein